MERTTITVFGALVDKLGLKGLIVIAIVGVLTVLAEALLRY